MIHRWWFPEVYKNKTPSDVWNGIANRRVAATDRGISGSTANCQQTSGTSIRTSTTGTIRHLRLCDDGHHRDAARTLVMTNPQ